MELRAGGPEEWRPMARQRFLFSFWIPRRNLVILTKSPRRISLANNVTNADIPDDMVCVPRPYCIRCKLQHILRISQAGQVAMDLVVYPNLAPQFLGGPREPR